MTNEQLGWAVFIATWVGYFWGNWKTIRSTVRNQAAMAEREKDMNEFYARFTRQDIAGVLTALFITNGLLGVIAALLVVLLLKDIPLGGG